MSELEIADAKSRLSELVDRAIAGEEMILTRAGTPLGRLVPVPDEVAPWEGGQWRGKLRIAEGFGEGADDLSRAFGTTDRPDPQERL